MILANIRSVKISSPDVRTIVLALYVALRRHSTEDGTQTKL